LRRGHDPAADALRRLFEELLLDEQAQRRVGALVGHADICYPTPNSDHHALTGAFAPNLTLHTAETTTSVAELMQAAQPILLDLADRPDLREIGRDSHPRVDIHTVRTDNPPADALLIRPDAHIAWAATRSESTDTAVPTLRAALIDWFGTPPTTPSNQLP
jgi:hypothetical protein